jgi:accessory colonization factor AcfC|tara:strand:+ start:2763 stop:2939 length:177 start_codon:yes stop_codon:yes gene_type:complete
MENTMDKVWIVFCHDGYDVSKVSKVFSNEEDAVIWRDFATKLADDRWNGWYMKEFDIE